MFEVFFDLETKKFFDDTGTNNPADLGVSICCVYSREVDENGKEISGQMQSFWEEDFDQMWKIFRQADRIIGFNSRSFDVVALKPYAPNDFFTLNHFDILEKIRAIIDRRPSLNSLARETLNSEKLDHGANAILYWEKHDKESLEKLQKYCEMDVIITRDIYDFAMKNKYLKYKDFWNDVRTIEIDFSYPTGQTFSAQTSLF